MVWRDEAKKRKLPQVKKGSHLAKKNCHLVMIKFKLEKLDELVSMKSESMRKIKHIYKSMTNICYYVSQDIHNIICINIFNKY